MPLRDHFNPPLSIRRHWEGFLAQWSNAIVDQLNEQLSSHHFAEPYLERTPIDVAMSHPHAAPLPATAFDVQVYDDEYGPRLTAIIELVSPLHKNRPCVRREFASTCAGYLQQGVNLIVVDIVTSGLANLHYDLLEMMSLPSDGMRDAPALHGTAIRTLRDADEPQLEIWLEPLAIGSRLPTLPLWLDTNAVAVDLEQAYEAACQTLRIE